MNYQTLTLTIDDRVAQLTLNRPARMNAFSDALLEEFKDAMTALDQDEAVRVVIVSGAGGKAFSSGYDLQTTAEMPKLSLEQLHARYAWQQTFNLSVWHCSKPVIAMIDGYCLAGALELAACCDIRYCSDTSKIGALEARFGGEIGLVDRVFAKNELAEKTLQIAKRMSRVAASCQSWNKKAINQTFEVMGIQTALKHGVDAAAILRAIGSPEREKFDELRRTEGLPAALAWRKALFEPFE